MVFSAVPNEILLSIADHLEQRDIYSFLRVSRRLHALLADYLLIHNVRHYGGNALIWATTRGHAATAHRLVKLGADVNREVKAEGTEMVGSALLHIAAYDGNMPMTRLLLELGANTEQWDACGRTPLFWALISKHLAVTEALCYRTADLPHALVGVPTRRTPLQLASEAGLFGFTISFVQIGMDISVRDADGKTPLEQVKDKLRRGHWIYGAIKEIVNSHALSRVLIALGEEPSTADSYADASVKLYRWCFGEDLEDEIHEFMHVLYGDPSIDMGAQLIRATNMLALRIRERDEEEIELTYPLQRIYESNWKPTGLATMISKEYPLPFECYKLDNERLHRQQTA